MKAFLHIIQSNYKLPLKIDLIFFSRHKFQGSGLLDCIMVKANEVDLQLLKKYFDNKCTPEEARQVLEWIARTDASTELDEEFKEVWHKIKVRPGDYSRWSAKLDKINERIEMESLYESLGVQSDKEHQSKSKDRPPVSGMEMRKDRGGTRLRFAITGIVMSLIIAMMGVFYWMKPAQVVQQEPEVVQKEKHTERGQKLSFHLEDGTRVQLNSNSRILYPAIFDSLERNVVLEGEAFFEVSKDADRPFKVITGSFVTTALGTSFNINAFKDKKNIEVALVSGKVSVGSTVKSIDSDALILSPGEMATVVKGSNTMSKASFDFKEKIAWKDGILFFKDADYEEITQRLENWYAVDITSNRQPGNWKFNVTFEKNATLENILISLQFAYDFEYVINGKDVNLKF